MGKKKKEENEKAPVSKCPDNSAFKQQRIPAWKLTLTPQIVLSSFFIIGLFCLSVGISWIVATSNVKEIWITYSDHCSYCSQLRENSSNSETSCPCAVTFSVKEKIQGEVFLYYGLSNFFQNNRRYVISRFDTQLLGRNVTTKESIQNGGYCAPFSVYNNGTPMAPCGAIANSMFNDSQNLVILSTVDSGIFKVFSLLISNSQQSPDAQADKKNRYNNTGLSTELHFHNPSSIAKTGNTWWSDKNVKFSNPKPNDDLVQAFAGSARPPYWQNPAYALDPLDPNNNGYINDDFINWMRVAAFPNFRKLYRRISRIQQFSDGLPPGNYTFVIEYNFPVSKFGGKKHVILSTLSWCGGSNMFLGIAYTVTGAAIVLTAFAMLAVHLKKRKPKKKFTVK